MFDVDGVNPPAYVRDPAFLAAFPAARRRLPLLSALKRLQRVLAAAKGSESGGSRVQQRAPSWSASSQERPETAKVNPVNGPEPSVRF